MGNWLSGIQGYFFKSNIKNDYPDHLSEESFEADLHSSRMKRHSSDSHEIPVTNLEKNKKAKAQIRDAENGDVCELSDENNRTSFSYENESLKTELLCNNCDIRLGSGEKEHDVTGCVDSKQNDKHLCQYCSCNATQKSVEEPLSYYSINDLPSTLLINIFYNLSLQDILHRVSLVCKQWHNLCCDPDLWRSISLRDQSKVNDAILLRLTSYSGNVTLLDLTDIKLTTNEGMVAALKQCSHLQFLSLVRNFHLTDYAFQAIGEHCRHLKTLKLDCCSALTDQSLYKIGEGCPKIDRLFLNQCSSISDDGLQYIANGCNNLKVLALEQCRKLTDSSLESITEKCKELRCLKLMSNSFSEKGMDFLSRLQHLEELEITQISTITDENLMHIIINCPKLSRLNVSLCTNITDDSVKQISKCSRHIRSLYLISCTITDEAMVSLSTCESLEQLDVGWCTQITDFGAVKVSEGCQNLQYLGLMRCDYVTRETIQNLVERFPGITYSTMWLECERLLAKARHSGYCFV